VRVEVRAYRSSDEEGVVALALRAWEPVFASMEEAMGHDIFVRQYPDWRLCQRQAVQRVLRNEAMNVSVAVLEDRVVGFVASVLHVERGVGEIWMLAVDPQHQQRGIGTALTQVADESFAAAGMALAMAETGGDRGHAPARRTYEKAGYTAMPIARYFKAL
jgi:ribosomal protein S18 acetylase RimI-like enzyme